MSVTVNSITVDFTANPPTVTFLQGANMDVTNIRDSLRQIEASDEGRMQEASPDARGFIVKSSGRESFDATTKNALTVTILPPFVVQFQAGALPFKTANGNLLADFVDSPGAIVQINNAVGATLFNSADIEYASFNGMVTIDPVNGVDGTAFPIGTPRLPVKTLMDAHTILEERGLSKFFVHGPQLIITDGPHAHDFEAHNHSTMIMVMPTGDVAGADFENCMVVGSLSGPHGFESAHLKNVTGVIGSAYDCMLEGTITLGGTPSGPHANGFHLVECQSAAAGLGETIIDMNSSGFTLIGNAVRGRFKITNKSGAESVSMRMDGGTVTIDSTVTNGVILISGVAQVIDNSTGTTQVIDQTVDGQKLRELHTAQGLEAGNPVTITQASRQSQDGSVNVAIGGDGVTNATLTRQ